MINEKEDIRNDADITENYWWVHGFVWQHVYDMYHKKLGVDWSTKTIESYHDKK